MYLLPLFKSLMQKVCSHMTEREGAMFVCVCVYTRVVHICILCGGMEVLVLLYSNKGFHSNHMHH